MIVKFFYRDGDNYKCVFEHDVDDDVWNDFVGGQSDEDFLDLTSRSSPLFDIKEFDMEMIDIPLIQTYGVGEADHPFVSILSYDKEEF